MNTLIRQMAVQIGSIRDNYGQKTE